VRVSYECRALSLAMAYGAPEMAWRAAAVAGTLAKVLRRRLPAKAVGDARRVGGCSSAGRAPRSQRGGQRFDPAQLHQRINYLAEKSGGSKESGKPFGPYEAPLDSFLSSHNCFRQFSVRAIQIQRLEGTLLRGRLCIFYRTAAGGVDRRGGVADRVGRSRPSGLCG
jgi:hypothetical protein